MKVIFDGSDFSENLSRAMTVNNAEEISQIIDVLNNMQFDTYVTLAKEIIRFVVELDPVDFDATVNHIVHNIRPEHRELFSPVRIVNDIRNIKPPVRRLRCL